MDKKPTCRQRCYRYLQRRAGVWVNGGEIERAAAAVSTYKASNVSRRLRELAEDKEIERKEEQGSVWYRWVRDVRAEYEALCKRSLQAFDEL